MKRIIAAGVALAVLALGGAGEAAAQGPSGKIAVVNIAEFLRNFEHAKQSGEMLTQLRQKYLDQVEGDRKAMTEIQKKLREPGADKDALEKQVIELQRKIQDIDSTAQKDITAKADESVVAIHKEARYFIEQVATANGYDMVFCYPGVTDPTKDLEKPVIARMMLQTPAAMPFFVNPKIDITKQVTETANTWYKNATSTTESGTGAGGK